MSDTNIMLLATTSTFYQVQSVLVQLSFYIAVTPSSEIPITMDKFILIGEVEN